MVESNIKWFKIYASNLWSVFRFKKGTYQNGWILVESPCEGECYNKKCNIKKPGEGISPSIAECYKPDNLGLNDNLCTGCGNIRNHFAGDPFEPHCGPYKNINGGKPKGVKCEV